jgi:hypothetical protein
MAIRPYDPGLPAAHDHDVGGLDVAMHHVTLAGKGQARGHLDGDVQRKVTLTPFLPCRKKSTGPTKPRFAGLSPSLSSAIDQRFEFARLLAADDVALLLAAPLVLALLADELVALLLAAPLVFFEAEKPGALKHRAATATAMVRRFMKHLLLYGTGIFKKARISSACSAGFLDILYCPRQFSAFACILNRRASIIRQITV